MFLAAAVARVGDGGVDPGLDIGVALFLVLAGLQEAFELVGVAGAAGLGCLSGLVLDDH
jgi:hypothetical protein